MEMTFSEYLAATMEARGFLTIAELSRETGIRDGVLSKWLDPKVKGTPRTYMLRKLVPALRVPLIELVVAAKIMTKDEARLDKEPAPPQPVDMEELYSMVEGSALTEEGKAQMRAQLDRLQRQADEQDRRSLGKRGGRSSEDGGNGERRSA